MCEATMVAASSITIRTPPQRVATGADGGSGLSYRGRRQAWRSGGRQPASQFYESPRLPAGTASGPGEIRVRISFVVLGSCKTIINESSSVSDARAARRRGLVHSDPESARSKVYSTSIGVLGFAQRRSTKFAIKTGFPGLMYAPSRVPSYKSPRCIFAHESSCTRKRKPADSRGIHREGLRRRALS